MLSMQYCAFMLDWDPDSDSCGFVFETGTVGSDTDSDSKCPDSHITDMYIYM